MNVFFLGIVNVSGCFIDIMGVGPCIGGIIVTFAHWRTIFWVQAGMAGLRLLLALLFVLNSVGAQPVSTNNEKTHKRISLANANPLPILKVLVYPNVLLTVLSLGVPLLLVSG
jgi:predicted MFS family arabinose efflux permease